MPLHWPSWFSTSFDWLQVEVSSCCNAACTYCPHTVYRDTWQSRLMPLEAFRRISSVFARTRLVYLQGWGEPLLHPQFFEFVRIAKAAGCRVGVTTNGMLLDEEKCLRLVNDGVDVIAFSLAGTDEQNDVIRKGTRIEHVFEIIRVLNHIKERSDRVDFDIHIAYMLLRSQVDALDRLPVILEGMGIRQVVISVLDFVGDPILARESLVPQTQAEYQALRLKLDGVAAAGRAAGFDVHSWLAAPPDAVEDARPAPETDLELALFLPQPDHCTENIRRAAFISADGEVSSCTYMNIPVSAAFFVGDGVELPYQRITFGNGQTTPMDTIWRSKVYRAFREGRRQGDMPPFCLACPRRRITATIV